MATLGTYPLFRAFDDDGNPLAGGQLFTYESGTSTPTAVYHDARFVDAWTNPVILDDAGEALVYFAGVQKWVLTDQWGVQQWEVDPVGLTPLPPDPAWATVGGGYVIGCGGVPQVVDPTHVRVGAYSALMPGGAYVVQPAVTVPLSGPDGAYWLALHEDATGDVEYWTRFPDTNLLWCGPLAAPPPEGNPQLLVVGCVTMSAGACSALCDWAPHRVTQPTTVASTMVTAGTWTVLPPGCIGVASGATWTCNGPLLAPNQPGILPGPGPVKFGPAQPANAVWFCASGSGLLGDPWVSADGCGGMAQACAAVGNHGSLVPAPGCYRFSSATAASFDLPVGVAGQDTQGDISVDMRGVHILVETTGTVFLLNKNGVTASTSSNLNTVRWEGGMFDTAGVVEGGMDASCPIRGTALDLSRTRNVTISGVKFRGLALAINANVADTLTIRECAFRRCFRAVSWPEVGRPDVPQDIWIEHNTGSISGNQADIDGCIFFDIQTRVANVHLSHNGVACDASNARFVKALTGGPGGDSLNLFIMGNATEQYEDGSKLVEIVRYGTGLIKNVVIRDNQWDSPLSSAPPWAQGQPYLDLAYCTGLLLIENNEFGNATVGAIKIDNLRSDANGVAAVAVIRGNHFRQEAASSGRLFDITNLAGNGTEVWIGRNAVQGFYAGTLGAMIYPPTQTRFETATTYTAAIAAAATITVAPWDSYVRVTGTTPVTTIAPTWKGHVLQVEVVTAAGRLVTDTGNLRLQGDLTARSTALPSTVALVCDGALWVEQSRFNQQTTESVAAAASVTINAFSVLVGLSGSGNVDTITGGSVGQYTVFKVTAGVTLKDGTGNLRLPADVVGSANGTYIGLVYDSNFWNAVGPATPA